LKQKKYARARKLFLGVISDYPLSWYSVMAYSRLREMNRGKARSDTKKALQFDGRADVPGADTTAWRMEVPADRLGPRWDRARLLARLGLPKEAWAALRNTGADDDPQMLWLGAWVLDRAGAYPLSHNILRRKLKHFRRNPPSGGMVKHWKIAYPKPYGAMIKKAAKATRINPLFAWGVIREESGFNPRVESFANAIGLMQLILPTARRMATRKEGRVTRARLKQPKFNVTLGTRYLRRLRDVTGANWAVIPAGYNAGDGALKRWMKARGHLPLDLFVETIPYEEARGYTKRVIASWATYRALYGGRHADPLPYFSQKVRVTAPKKKRRKKRRGKRRSKRRPKR
jgi:soluble lytic murein transglycosylase